MFYYDYTDMQNLTLINITNVIGNNDTTVYGGELELASRPTDNFDLSAGIGYLDSKVQDIFNPDRRGGRHARHRVAPRAAAHRQPAGALHLADRESQFWVQGTGRYRDESGVTR